MAGGKHFGAADLYDKAEADKQYLVHDRRDVLRMTGMLPMLLSVGMQEHKKQYRDKQKVVNLQRHHHVA
jgi:hypothetical protein